jgi:hypothetical protein
MTVKPTFVKEFVDLVHALVGCKFRTIGWSPMGNPIMLCRCGQYAVQRSARAREHLLTPEQAKTLMGDRQPEDRRGNRQPENSAIRPGGGTDGHISVLVQRGEQTYRVIGDLRTFLERSATGTVHGAEAVRVGSKVIDSLRSSVMQAP